LASTFARSLRRAGFQTERKDVEVLADQVVMTAMCFPTGTVIERRGDAFRARPAGKE
jgi:hypothetical protein